MENHPQKVARIVYDGLDVLSLEEAKQRALANSKLLNLASLNAESKAFAVKADTGTPLWTFDSGIRGAGPNRAVMYWKRTALSRGEDSESANAGAAARGGGAPRAIE
jgi:outer membrane protein assembly factor BamB